MNSENIYISGDNLDGLKSISWSPIHAKSKWYILIRHIIREQTDLCIMTVLTLLSMSYLKSRSISEEHAQRIPRLNKAWFSFGILHGWCLRIHVFYLLGFAIRWWCGFSWSIYDNENHNLKLYDDVFGEDNFVAQIIVQSSKRGRTYKQLAKTHEYIFSLYAEILMVNKWTYEWSRFI